MNTRYINADHFKTIVLNFNTIDNYIKYSSIDKLILKISLIIKGKPKFYYFFTSRVPNLQNILIYVMLVCISLSPH